MKTIMKGVALLAREAVNVDPVDVIDDPASARNKTVRVYSIAHPGRIRVMLDRIKRVLQFPEFALRSVLAAISPRAPAMPGHAYEAEDQLSTRGRKILATVVGKAIRKIGDKTHALIALAFDSAEDARRFPKISLEGIFHERNGVVRNVERITGLGLLPESGFAPGFPESGAVSGAVLCAIEDEDGPGDEAENELRARIGALEARLEEMKNNKKENTEMPTLAEIKAFLQENPNLRPSDLGFDSNAVLGEIEVNKDGKLTFEGGDRSLTRVLQKILNGQTIVPDELLKEQREKAEQFGKIEEDYKKLAARNLADSLPEYLDQELKRRGVEEKKAGDIKKYLLAPSRVGKLNATGDPEKDRQAYLTSGLEDYEADTASAGSAGVSSSDNGTQPNSDGQKKTAVELIEQTDLTSSM